MKRMKHAALALLVVAILPCCGGGTQKIVRHGEAWFSTRCGRMSDCLNTAEEICPGGYKEDRAASAKNELLFTCTHGNVNWHP